MPGVPLSLAVSRYDHLADLVSGRVRLEGIDLLPLELPIEEIFFRMFTFEEFDVSEFSMAKYVSLVATGDAHFSAIPVFPSRVFRQSSLYVATASGIATPRDFAGRRVGVPEWVQTAGIYARAFLQHQCGLNLADVRWVQAGVNQAGRAEKVLTSLPDGIRIEQVREHSLNEMLLAGELDAIISAREPSAFLAGDPRIARLFPDYRGMEEDYYRATAIFPIMHVIVIKNEALRAHPWIAMNLFRGFEQAKANSLKRISSIVHSPMPIPWTAAAYHRATEVFGADPWPYGIEANKPTLTAFLQFCAEQGVTPRTVSVDELFPRELTKIFKV